MSHPPAHGPLAVTTRGEFFDLFWIYVPVGAAVFVLVVLMLAIALTRRRAGGPRGPSHLESTPRLESAYVVMLAVIAGLLVWRTYAAMDHLEALNAPAPASAQAFASGSERVDPTIRVVAAKWSWRFDYGGGVVQQTQGLDHPATLVVPANTRVRFRLTSLDVAHAFWISDLRYKYDAYPGRTSVFDLVFPSDLTYPDNRCAEFCGEFHSRMTFRVDVRTPAAFRAWLSARRRGATA